MKQKIRYSELSVATRPDTAMHSPASYTPHVSQKPTTPVVQAIAAIPLPVLPPSEPVLDDARRASMRPLRERVRLRRGLAELLLFRVHHELFAVELGAVEEAIDMPEVHHVPEMTPCMLGVITVRGGLTAVFSPEHVLGLPLASRASALVFRRERSRLAIVVDDIDDVVTVDLAELRDASSDDGVVLGVAKHEDALVAVLDADALITACQALPALETA